MRCLLALAAAVFSASILTAAAAASPIRLHPRNPHYFLWRGKSTVLVASTEHYGSVLNADFEYRRYLDKLKSAGLNYTRIFSGIYSEPWGEPFNTLNPPKGRLLCPWARSDVPGYIDGGNKFDLSRWDEAYFRRLNDFIGQADRRGIVVELTLFCNWYDDKQWRLSPLHPSNNVNSAGALSWKDVNTLKAGATLGHEEAMVRKIAAAVNRHDNLFFEICNEPGADREWMDHMAKLVEEAEADLPRRHLIANNGHPVPNASLLNAHYDRDLSFVRSNYGRQIALGYDETGFDGAEDRAYRRQGWRFLLSGGAVYDNLDWSFSVAHPDGSETQWNKNLGGGSPSLRRQLGVLLSFMNRLDLTALAPDNAILKSAPPGAAAMSTYGWQTAVYLESPWNSPLVIAMPGGSYRAEWVDTANGSVLRAETIRHAGGELSLTPPGYEEDVALRVLRIDGKRPATAPAPRKPAGLHRAVNLGGGPLVVNGVPWEGRGAHMAYSGSAFEDQSVALNPPVDAARAAMIRSSIWNPEGSNVTLTGVPPGDYDVYLTVWEDTFLRRSTSP